MYYRIAIEVTSTPGLRWVTTTLSSLNSVMDWLRYYGSVPRERLRIFSAASRDDLSEQLAHENQGLAITSTPATTFLLAGTERPGETQAEAAAGHSYVFTKAQSGSATHQVVQTLEHSRTRALDVRRDELERGAGGDHDCPYRFSLPFMEAELRAWVALLVKAQRGDLRADAVAVVDSCVSA